MDHPRDLEAPTGNLLTHGWPPSSQPPFQPKIERKGLKNDVNDVLWSLLGAKRKGRTSLLRHFYFILFLFFCHMACGILVPQPGIEPVSLHWKHRVLNTGPTGRSSVGSLELMLQAPPPLGPQVPPGVGTSHQEWSLLRLGLLAHRPTELHGPWHLESLTPL